MAELKVTGVQKRRIFRMAQVMGVTDVELEAWLVEKFGAYRLDELTARQASDAIKILGRYERHGVSGRSGRRDAGRDSG